MLPPLTVMSAGAGSGKTHTLKEQLGTWVTEGQVDPARIVAVTFTEAAAAELRERIRAQLLELNRPEDALRLDRAYISTIHGFGLRLLKEFAFDAGLSPSPRLLDEHEGRNLLRLAVARTDKADAITADLARFGYRFDFGSQKGPEELFRDDLLQIVTLLRATGWSEAQPFYAERAVAWLKDRYGFTGSGTAETDALHRAICALLQAFPESLAREYEQKKSVAAALASDYSALRAGADKSRLETDWALWQTLRKLRLSTTQTKLPPGYDELAGAVVEAANALPQHPGPRAQAEAHIEALIAAGQDVLVHYAQLKRAAGAVDFTDMIAMAAALLRDSPEVLESLAQRVDCLVIDEFQDTNPLQFALLWQLKEAGVPTVIVGDLKQAIMGFQGADPRLFEQIIAQNGAAVRRLDKNWRSQPPLMDFINAVGPVLFGEQYDPLAPQGRRGDLAPLEVLAFPQKAKSGQHTVRALAVAKRIKSLLEDRDDLLWDPELDDWRRLYGSEIAVLCPTHGMLDTYSSVLRCQGLQVRRQEGGWYESRPVQLACQALAYLSNPGDRHAALFLAVTELGSQELKTALEQLMVEEGISDPVLAKLDALREQAQALALPALLDRTLITLRLFTLVAEWPDGEQGRANLLRLQAEAREFVGSNREALASGGFHGIGVSTFLAWLKEKVAEREGNDQPDPRVIDQHAIQLVTWHSAKGREWPAVFVCGLDQKLKPRLPNLALGYSDFDDLAGLSDKARIEYSPKFSSPEATDRFASALAANVEVEARRLAYVALTRARDKLVLEWPSYVLEKEALTYCGLLAPGMDLDPRRAGLKVGESTFPCRIEYGGTELPEALDVSDEFGYRERTEIGRIAIAHCAAFPPGPPDSIAPSAMKGSPSADQAAQPLISFAYHAGLVVDLEMSGLELGTFLHRCFEVLGARPDLTGKIAELAPIPVSTQALAAIADSVATFEAWLATHFSPREVHRELPLLGLDRNRSVVVGSADLVVDTAEGVWVIDHKSDRVSKPLEAFDGYRGQLEGYAGLLTSMDRRVAGYGINWLRRGEVVLQKL